MDWRKHLPSFVENDETEADQSRKSPPPPADEFIKPPSAFCQFGNVLVRPAEVVAIFLYRDEKKIDFALKNGEVFHAIFNPVEKYDFTVAQIAEIFNVDIKEP